MSAIMIDIETLGTTTDSVIATIGAVRFNIEDNTHLDTFYTRVDIDDCKEKGLKVVDETINWWKNQPEQVNMEIFDPRNRRKLKDSLISLSRWIGNNFSEIWCHGCSFDFPILENAYRKCNLEIPWKFYQQRDTRTIFKFCDVHRSGENLHNALSDCIDQVTTLQDAYNKFYY